MAVLQDGTVLLRSDCAVVHCRVAVVLAEVHGVFVSLFGFADLLVLAEVRVALHHETALSGFRQCSVLKEKQFDYISRGRSNE